MIIYLDLNEKPENRSGNKRALLPRASGRNGCFPGRNGSFLGLKGSFGGPFGSFIQEVPFYPP